MASTCNCAEHAPKPYQPLTILKLQLWQRERFHRPYNSLKLTREFLREKLGRNLDQNDVSVLTEFLENFPQKVFQLRGSNIADLNVVNLFQCFRCLWEVTLSGVNLNEGDLHVLLANLNCVRILDLSGNVFDDKQVELVREFLICSMTIEHLDVSSCLSTKTLAVVADGVYRSRTLVGLDVSHLMPISEFQPIDGVKVGVLMGILLGQRKLTELYLRGCALEGLESMNEYLSGKNPLRVLDVSSNNLGSEIESLLEAIKHGVAAGNKLTILNMSASNLEKNATCLAFLLPFTKIRHLNIANNNIPAETTKFILYTLHKTHSMKTLCIYGNRFDQECGEYLKLYKQGAALLCDVCVTSNLDVIRNHDPEFVWAEKFQSWMC